MGWLKAVVIKKVDDFEKISQKRGSFKKGCPQKKDFELGARLLTYGGILLTFGGVIINYICKKGSVFTQYCKLDSY